MARLVMAARGWEGFGQRLAAGWGSAFWGGGVSRFHDGELRVGAVSEARAAEVVLVGDVRGEGLFELMLLADAARRSGAKRVRAVVPYMAYARQDREVEPGVAVSMFVAARALLGAVDGLVTADIHSPEALAFFEGRAVNASVLPRLAAVAGRALLGQRLCVAAPDAGSSLRARAFADALEAAGCGPVALAMVDKRRSGPGEVASARLVGEVAGCHCVLVDDMIDTAGTLCAAAEALRLGGAEAVSAAAAHGLFSGPAVERLMGAGLGRIWVADTVPLPEGAKVLRALEVVGVAEALAEAL